MAKLDWYIRAGLKLRHLQMLVALDDLRNQGKVAAFMNVTQPALSKAMAELQTGLGHQVFERTGRGLRPTAYGEGLIKHARRVLQDLSDAGEELHALATGTSRKLRVGALPASASWLVPKALALFKEASPRSSIAVRESTMDVLLNELRLGNLDMIVGTLPTRQMGTDLEETALFEDATALITKTRHPLAVSAKAPTWEQVAQYPWVLPPHDSLLRQPLIAAFFAYGVEPPTNFVESLSLNVTLNYIQSSSAIASLPASLARKYAALGALAILPLKLPRLVRPVGMIWLKHYSLTDSDRIFVRCIEEAAKDLAAGG